VLLVLLVEVAESLAAGDTLTPHHLSSSFSNHSSLA
jgi:hypothetical protein